MKKKGFTLVEVIGVITLIGVLALITIPITKNLISNSREKSLKASKDTILKVSKNYFVDKNYLPVYDGSQVSVTVNELVEGSYLDATDIVNPVTEKPLDGCAVVKYDDSTKSYNYEYADECGASSSIPRLENNLIPVYYDDISKVWKTVGNNGHWYDYKNKEYANAVVVSNPKIYKNIASGTEIPDDQIISFFVWIPRFEYSYDESLTDDNMSFDVKFINKEQLKADKGYHIHPAFTYKGKQIEGFWISKFQTSGTLDNISAKPNEQVSPNVNIASIYNAISKFSNNNKIADDVRMEKGSEFMANFFLAHSNYGTYAGKSNDESFIDLIINNTNLNGKGNYKSNVSSSSTGNVTGIYDIYSIRDEKTLSNLNGFVSSSSEFVSGFKGTAANGYVFSSGIEFPKDYEIDIYKNGDINKGCNNSSCEGYLLSNMYNRLKSGEFIISEQPYSFFSYGCTYYNLGIKSYGVINSNGIAYTRINNVTRMTLVIE